MTHGAPPLPIRVVCATRLSNREFFASSLTGKCLLAFQRTAEVELALYPTNSQGLSEVYNGAIEACRTEPRILVFLHDDCLIADFWWTSRVREGLERFDIVGIVGNRRRVAGQPTWIIADLSGRQDDYANLSGAIGQGVEHPPRDLTVFGPPGVECKLLDGVFLAASSETLHRSALRFDPRFAFHFYDMDFCRSAERANCRMGTVPLALTHASLGSLDDAWMSAYRQYIEKWQR